MTDSGNELVRLAHRVDELAWGESEVLGARELGGCAVERASEAVTDREESGDKRRDEVLAGTGRDDGRHRAGDGRSVVGREHEHHLEELCWVSW